MADYIATILTPWTIDADGTDIDQLWTDYRRTLNPDGSIDQDGVYARRDITGTAAPHLPPSPNLCVVLVAMPEATLDTIEGDNTYKVLTSQEMT